MHIATTGRSASVTLAQAEARGGGIMDIDRFFEKEVGHMPFGQPSRDDRVIETLREMFADQNRQMNAQGQLLAQQTQRIDMISTQIAAFSQQQEALRSDFNQRWQDLPKLYVPRQEHQAMALDARTAALEEFRMAATRDIADIRLTIQQQIQAAVQTASQEIAAAKLAAKDEINLNRKALDARQIAVMVSGITVAISIVVEIILKLIFH